jgi:mannose-6-phosphate isomerase-like protein (cupin superfamily)
MDEGNVRQWGRYDILYEGEVNGIKIKVKKISVNPNSRLSLQSHNHREEYWRIVQGDGHVKVGNLEKDVSKGDTISIPEGRIHRVGAYGKGLVLIEVQTGKSVDESDIVRIEDDYGRVKKAAE